MARFVKYEPCPECRSKGRDRRGDNLGRYDDGSGHCFSCGHHEHPKGLQRYQVNVDAGKQEEGPLPRDFTRTIPATGWQWLLQYGLPFSYWKEYCGYSPSTSRLIITHGTPIETSVGRYVGTDDGKGTGEPPRKWRQWGDKLRSATVLESPSGDSSEVVLVEDLVSAHKVRQVTACLPLFGTTLYPKAVQALRA